MASDVTFLGSLKETHEAVNVIWVVGAPPGSNAMRDLLPLLFMLSPTQHDSPTRWHRPHERIASIPAFSAQLPLHHAASS